MTIAATVAGRQNPLEALIERLTVLLTGSASEDYDAERGQAVTRVINGPLTLLYLIVALLVGGQDAAFKISIILVYAAIYIPASWVLLLRTIKRPGYNFGRRAFAMVNDYLAMTFVLALGGAYTLPVWALVLWVTVGNGLRFGLRYLVAATGGALASLVVTWMFNEYWQANPFMVMTLAITAILVPAYIFGLLARLQTVYNTALEANLAKSKFLAQASHDLRQPIHAISLYIACLRDAGLGPEERSMVENIDRSLHSVSRLFRSLLDISTLDSGKVRPNLKPVAIGKLLEEIAQQNSRAAEWARVSLRVAPCAQHVLVDDVLLTTMIQNILSNALKYAPGRNVLLGCRRRGGGLAITVHDQGDGIAEVHLPHVFEEFYQIREKGDRDVEGVGLGLPIVLRLGRLMNLTVGMRSFQGRGTTVIIEGMEIVPAPAIQARRNEAPLPSVTSGLRVLLVEDDQDVLLATAMLLEKWGCTVRAETAPPATVDGCDVLVTDFDLGAKRTGADCIALVRKLAREDVPAIVMTGHDETRVRAELEDPSIPILAKPVHPAEMRSVLSAVVLRMSASAEAKN
ncbi:ATP-binding response regulator [Chelativorans alearense]|uniref:ATP-binding response regulator n=1 Tax=Chelativorans alearense TaxID=2681495 RepID=UPI0013D20711|nr:hybrid sensor histidine kinase/response regulator [Chelativorans alearense]